MPPRTTGIAGLTVPGSCVGYSVIHHEVSYTEAAARGLGVGSYAGMYQMLSVLKLPLPLTMTDFPFNWPMATEPM